MRSPFALAPFVLAAVLFAASAARAQGLPPPGALPPLPSFPVPAEVLGGDPAQIQVGQWVEYDYRTSRMQEPIVLHIAIVGRENGGTWMETTFERQSGERIIARVLTNGPLGGSATTSVRRMIMQASGLPPFEVPPEQVAAVRPPIETPRGAVPVMAPAGEESLHVGAGTFPARHVHGATAAGDIDAWTNRRVPLGGLLRYRSPTLFMELRAFGFGATTRIQGTPGRLQLPPVPGAGPATP